MSNIISYILDKTPYIQRLRQRLREIERAEGQFPAGHHYSPIPSIEQVQEYVSRGCCDQRSILEIDLREEAQANLIETFQQFYNEMSFPREQRGDFRYFSSQRMFFLSDAIALYCILRQVRPERIVEVGSGYSSAAMLDTAEKYLNYIPDMTLIDPSTDRLRQLLKPGDEENIHIVQDRVQNVPLNTFASLDHGDLLFIDSSHVVSAGSDVQYLFFEVLPRLKPGVFVHFHDVVWPFTYPTDWLLSGRYWNEAYFLRAFLAYNCNWEIYWFNSYVSQQFEAVLAEKMPLFLTSVGGSIYLRRTE